MLQIFFAPQTVSAEVPSTEHVRSAWSDDRNPIWQHYTTEQLSLWSLQVPVRPHLPEISKNNWTHNPIDAFILHRLTEANLTPGPPAGSAALLRRLSFGLRGLPPSPEELQQFLNDGSPDRVEQQIERFLADPRFGEHQARRWLDVVRYADTNGFERDEFRPFLWRYRDYVISAMNSDLPYDQFLREQLAGDELAKRPLNPLGARQLIATGYLRLGAYDTTQEIFAENERGRDQFLNDVVNTTGSAFLGLTFSCCQCHDHKSDPLLQDDHRRLRAFFASLKFDDEVVVELPDIERGIRQRNEPLDLQIERVKSELRGFLNQERAALHEELLRGFPPDIRQLLNTPIEERSEAVARRLLPYERRLSITDREVFNTLSEADRKRCRDWQEEIRMLTKQKEPIAVAVGVRENQPMRITARRKAGPPPAALTPRARPRSSRVTPGPGLPTMFEPHQIPVLSRQRTQLANWITSPRNPLTARVMVNRIWQNYFGVGLVTTPNDFGSTGQQPTHPELLDWLAVELMEHNWSLKHIHRLILNSATYQQSSAVREDAEKIDPYNRLLWRQNLKRLEAETLRDAMLSASGGLLPKHSGKPIWPVVREELLVAQPGILASIKKLAEGRRQGWYTDPIAAGDVRSLFLIHKRGLRPPFLQPFDVPDLIDSCGRRSQTTGSPQALTLLNSAWTERMAVQFAARLQDEGGPNPAAQVHLAFQLAFSRAPTPEEITASLHYLRSLQIHDSSQEAGRSAELVAFCRVLFNFNEFLYID